MQAVQARGGFKVMAKDRKTEEKSIERRKHRRYDYRTSLWLEIVPEGRLRSFKTINVSAEGLLIETDKEFPLNSPAKLHLELPHFLDLITAEGYVVHVETNPETGLTRIGIKLENIEQVTVNHLVKFLKVLLET